MSRHRQTGTPVEMLLAKVTYTETGYPASVEDVQRCYGPRIAPATRGPDWFWIGATERAARDLRLRGLKVIGELTTTLIPKHGPFNMDENADVPLLGSPEHIRLMLDETAIYEEAEGHDYSGGFYWAEAPEDPPGPLRKVIVFRLAPVEAAQR